MVDVGRLKHRLLRLGQFRYPCWLADLVRAAVVVQVLGRVPVEQGAAVVVRLPRQGSVQRILAKDDHVAGLQGHLVNDFWMLLPSRDLPRTRKVRLVAARDDAEATVAGVLVVQGVLNDEQATAHLTVGICVEAGAIKEDVGGAVDTQALDTLRAGN